MDLYYAYDEAVVHEISSLRKPFQVMASSFYTSIESQESYTQRSINLIDRESIL